MVQPPHTFYTPASTQNLSHCIEDRPNPFCHYYYYCCCCYFHCCRLLPLEFEMRTSCVQVTLEDYSEGTAVVGGGVVVVVEKLGQDDGDDEPQIALVVLHLPQTGGQTPTQD